MNLLAEFKALKDRVSAFLTDQSKATLASLTELSTKLTNLEAGALAQLEAAQTSVKDLTAKLGDATAGLTAANGELGSIKAALGSALTALKLEVKADASPADMIAALQGGVAGTLAKLNVPAGSIPAGKPQDKSQDGGFKSMSLSDFRKLNPAQQMAFTKECRAGAAKLVD